MRKAGIFRVDRVDYDSALMLRYWEPIDEDHVAIAKPVELEVHKRSEALPYEPMMRLDDFRKEPALQSLADELWRLGYRPSKETFDDSAKAVMTGHLNDMRKIAWKLLKIDTDK